MQKLSITTLFALCAVGAQAQADCASRIVATQQSIEQEVAGELTAQQQQRLSELLTGLCNSNRVTVIEEDIGTTYGTQALAQQSNAEATDEETKKKRKYLLNLDFKQAEERTKGHERLRKKR